MADEAQQDTTSSVTRTASRRKKGAVVGVSSTVPAIIEQARKRFKFCVDIEAVQREESKKDMDFYSGKQWPDQIKTDRDMAMKPCLTINRLPEFTSQVENEQRQNRPSIHIAPRGGGADEELADIYEGIVRDIQLTSDADSATDTAFSHVVRIGWGWIRVRKEFLSDDSFDQQLIIERVPDPFKVYMDPNCVKADYSDAKYCFVFEDLTKEEFELEYPGKDATNPIGLQTDGGDAGYWWPAQNMVRVAEYIFLEDTDDTLYLLDDEDGTTILKSQYNEERDGQLRKDDNGQIIERPTKRRRVRWVKMNGSEVLKEVPWEGTYLPVVKLAGDEIMLDGRRQLIGMVRFTQDSQRQYNYIRSDVTHRIALMPKHQFVAAGGQVERYKAQWESANTSDQMVLLYDPIDVGGQVLPPPRREESNPPIAGLVAALQQAEMDLQHTTKIYRQGLGEAQGDQSGRAILALQKEGDIANFGLLDNVGRGLKHLARILVEMIPHVYDVPRVQRIVKADGSEEMVMINTMFRKDGEDLKRMELPDGTPTPDGAKFFKVANKRARFDITATIGPSQDTQRKEMVSNILDLVKAYPQIMQFAGDLLVAAMDWHGAKEIAQRLKAMLPPQLQGMDSAAGQSNLPPAARAQFVQLLQQNQQLQQMLQSLVTTIRTKKMELDSQERRALWNIQAGLAEAAFKNDASFAEKMAELDYTATEHRLNLLPSTAAAEAAGTAAGTPAPPPQEGQPQSSPQAGAPATGGPSVQ